MSHRGKERTLLRECTAITYHGKSVHLKAIVIVETKRLMPDHTRSKLKSTGRDTIATTRVTTVKYRHIVLLCHLVDGGEKRQEILLCIYILLPMSTQQDVFAFLQPQASMHIAGFNLCKILVKHLGHGRPRHVRAFPRQPAISQVTTSMFGIRHIHVRDDIYYTTVRFLR